MTLKSWELNTLTSDGFLIDRVSNGLSISFPCNAPCQTCLADNPNYCLTCNALTGSTILYSNRCYSKCPDRLYVDEFNKCQPCQKPCYTCKQDNPKSCLSCDILSDFPFLDGNTCRNECPFGYFKNNKTLKCEKCHASCETCIETGTKCVTCGGQQFKY